LNNSRLMPIRAYVQATPQATQTGKSEGQQRRSEHRPSALELCLDGNIHAHATAAESLKRRARPELWPLPQPPVVEVAASDTASQTGSSSTPLPRRARRGKRLRRSQRQVWPPGA
jgi:hypothetical protein